MGLFTLQIDMSKKDGITLTVGDKNEPSMRRIRLPDIEIGESLKRLCTNDEIKKCLYDAVNGHKKMSRSPWKEYAIRGGMLIMATVVGTIVGKLL